MRQLLLAAMLLMVNYFSAGAQEPPPDTLVVGVKDAPPFIFLEPDAAPTGISVWLWEQMAADLGLAYRYESLTLEALLDSLETGAVDLSINPLTVTSERIERIDFTQPFFVSNSAIAAPASGGVNSMLQFVLQFFSLNFLKAVFFLFGVIFVFGFVAWLFERRQNPEEFEPGWRGLWSGIWWSAVTMTTVGYGDKSPRSLGGRIVALVWMFTAIIIISGFTAAIASSLTVTQLGSTIEDLNDLRDSQVATVTASASEDFLKSQFIDVSGVETLEDGLNALVSDQIEAFVYDEPILRYAIQRDSFAELRVLPFRFNQQYYSFALPKASPLIATLNPVLLRTIEEQSWRVVLSEYHLTEFK